MGTQQFCLRWNNHNTNMLNVFEELLDTENLCDVTLACSDSVSIKAHKVVLSACSPYFRQLFREHPCKHPIVVLKDVSYNDLRALVEFMYKGEVNVSQDQLPTLLKTADVLKIKGLAEVTEGMSSRDSNSDRHESSSMTNGASPPRRRDMSPQPRPHNRPMTPPAKRRKKIRPVSGPIVPSDLEGDVAAAGSPDAGLGTSGMGSELGSEKANAIPLKMESDLIDVDFGIDGNTNQSGDDEKDGAYQSQYLPDLQSDPSQVYTSQSGGDVSLADASMSSLSFAQSPQSSQQPPPPPAPSLSSAILGLGPSGGDPSSLLAGSASSGVPSPGGSATTDQGMFFGGLWPAAILWAKHVQATYSSHEASAILSSVNEHDPRINRYSPIQPRGGEVYIFFDEDAQQVESVAKRDYYRWHMYGRYQVPQTCPSLVRSYYHSVNRRGIVSKQFQRVVFKLIAKPQFILTQYLGDHRIADTKTYYRKLT